MAGPRQRQIVIAGDTINSFREKVNLIAEDVGATDRLTTTEDSDLVGAINEHDAELGTITSVAMGTTASTVSTAIAELDTRLDSINDTLLNTPKLWVRDSAATSYLHGNVQMQSDLGVRGNVQVDSNITLNGDLNVGDSARVTGNFSVGSATTLGGNLNVAGNVQVDGTLTVEGVVNFKAGSSGSVTLGDANTDNVVFNADVNSSIIPNTDNTYDLGSSSQEWRHVYIDGTASIDNVAADSATIGTLKVSDLTNNRLLIAGVSGEVEDDVNLTFDGTTLTVGNTTIHRLTGGINTTGLEADSATITGDLDVQGLTTLDSTTVDGSLTVTYPSTFQKELSILEALTVTDSAYITGNLRVVGNITSDSRAFYIQADSAGTDQVNFGETIRVRGGEGIDARRDGSNGWYIDAEVATSSNLGVAKFNTADFTVTAGDVTIKSAGVSNTQLVNSSITFADSTGGTAVALGGTVTLTGTADEINVTRSSSTFNIGLPSDVSITNNLTVGNDFTVGGDFNIAGEQRIAGQYVFLLDGQTGSPVLNAGITVDRGTADSAQLIWDEGNDYWKASYSNAASTLSQIITAANIDNSTLEFTSGTVKVKNNGIALGTKTTGNYIATIAGTANEVEVSGSGTETAAVTIGLPNSVTITNTLTASNLVVSDSATISTKLTTSDLVVSDSAYIGGTLTVGGNFRVAGTTTTVNTETVTIDDNIIVLNNNAAGVPSENAGIEVERGDQTNAQLLWNEGTDRWTVAGATTGTLAYTSEIGNATITLTAGTDLSTGGNFTTNASSNKTVTFNHADITRTDSTSTASPAHGATFTAIDTITTNARGHITGVNTKTVTLPAGDNYVSWTLSGDGGTPQTIASGNTVDIAGGTYITTTASATDTLTVAHDTTTRTNTTDSASPAHGGTFTAIDSITTNSTGHITAVNTKTITLPAGDDYISWTAADSDGTTYTITSADTLTIRGDQVGVTTNFVADDVLQINHAATSAQASVNNSGGNYIQDVTLDQFGHVTALTSTQVAYANVSGTPTIGDATITISAGTGLTTGGNFTTNATANKTITLAVDYGTSLLIKNSAGTTLKTIKGVA